jgi:TP901 family phage tail tape measure protein
MGVLKIALGAAATAAGGFTAAGIVRETAAFEQSLLRLQVVSGATTTQMAELEAQSRSLGATSMFSAQQAADAQNYLAMAGFRVNEVLSATPGILQLAASGNMDLAKAADLASNVLGGMRLEVEELTRVNDVLARTANGGANTSIIELGDALSYAAPLAATAGISLEETSAALGALADAGLKSTRSGTGLLGFIRQLSNVTPNAESALEKYGLTTADVNIEQEGLLAVLERLREANINTADSFKIFGSEVGPAAQILASSSEKIGNLTEALHDVEGAAAEAALILGSGLEGSFRSLNSAIGESTLQLGRDSGMSAALQEVINTATGVISVYNGMLPQFQAANDLTDEQARNLNNTATAISLTAGAVGGLTAAYVSLTAATWAAHAAQTALMRIMRVNPIILAAGAVASLSGALYTARNRTVEFGDTTATVSDWISGAWSTSAEIFAENWNGAVDSTVEAFEWMAGPVGKVVNWFSVTFEALMTTIGSLTQTTINSMIGYFGTIGDVVGIVTRTMQTLFSDAFDNILNVASGFWQSVQAVFSGDLTFSAFNTALDNLTNGFVGTMAGAADEIGAAFRENMDRNYLGEVFDSLSGGARFVADDFTALGERISDAAFVARMSRNGFGVVAEGFSEGKTQAQLLQEEIERLNQGLGESEESAKAATKETYTLADAYESLLDRITPNRREARQYAQDLGTLNLALASGRMTAQQYMQAMGMLQESFQAAQRDTTDIAEVTDVAADEMARAWEEASNRIDETFADAFRGAFNSFESFSDQLLNGFKRLLAELAYQATLKPIVVAFTGDMQGMMSGGAGGFGNTIGAARSLFSSGSSLLGGGSTAVAAGGLYSGASTGLAAGGLYGNAVTGGVASTGIMSSITAGVSAAMPWIAGGLAIDGLLGGSISKGISGAISSVFGGSWETKDAGLNLGVSAGDITGNQYERQHKSGGWFSSSKSRTNTRALSGDLRSMLQEAYSAQEQSLALTLEVLGQQSSALNAFSSGLTRISTKGKSEAEVEQAVQEWLQNTVNRAARSVVDPSEYAMAGETTVETLNRLATALTGVNPLLELLHDSSLAASLAGGDAAAQLLELAGGLDEFTARADYYYQNILTEAERQERAVTAAARAMGAFTARTGRVIESTDALRELVDGIDLTTASGRELYNEAMNLAPALVEVENGLERVRGRFEDMLSDAENALSSAEQQARNAYAAFEKQSFDQQLQLLGLMGDEQAALALQRERELQGIDPLLQETQRRIWAMEDEAAAQQAATRAGQEYARSLAQINDQLSSTFNGISQWVDQQTATAGTPGMNLAEAGDQFARQLVLAQAGDRNALQSITQYAEQYLAAGEAMYASGGAFQRIQGDVLDALKDLPDQISAEEYIAEEVKQALREQTQGISTQLGDVLRGDNPSNIAGNLAGYFTTLAGGIDGVLTREQLAIVMSGKATDAELQAIMRAVDLNGDGVINGLESVVIAGMPTDAVLGTVLRNKMNELDKNQLTHAQVRNALSPIAKQGQINQLINRADRNADGIITAQELANASLDGLASGIGSALYPMFDSLDSSLDGLIDYAEFASAFEGMATDAQLRELFNMLDANGDGQLSKLEALEQSSEGTEGNTKTMEERGGEQLSKLVQLSQEMTRTTDQFVGLNSTMVSLKDSITALGVAQEEVARIEQERLAAEKAERERIERERVEAQRGSLASEIDRLQREQQSLANTGVSAPSRSVINSSYRHVPDAINNINRIVDSILGSSGVTDRSVERLRDYYTQGPGFTADQGVGDAPGAGGAYSPGGLYWPYVEAYLREIESAIDTRQSATSLDSEIARLRAELNKLNSVDGSHATGLWNVPFDGYIAELHRDEMVVPAQTAGRLRELPSRELPMPALPNFPLLNRTDQHDVVRDLLNENKTLRKELTALLKRIEQHGAAGVAVQQEAAKQQISELKKSNLALDDMSAAARLEALR